MVVQTQSLLTRPGAMQLHGAFLEQTVLYAA